MSLSNRLRVMILGLVIIVTGALSMLYLRTLVDSIFDDLNERARMVAVQAAAMVEHRVMEVAASRPKPKDLPEAHKLWSGIIESDPDLLKMLGRMLVEPKAILDILVVGPDGRILASLTQQPGQKARDLEDFGRWQTEHFWTKLVEIFTGDHDYALSTSLGAIGHDVRPIFHVQVIISSVLTKHLLMPALSELGVVTLFSLMGSILLAIVFSRYVSRPLERVTRQLDRISAGAAMEQSARESHRRLEPRELVAVESKLAILGQQYKGAKNDALQLRGNLELMLQRLEDAVLLFDASGRLNMAGPAGERLLGRRRAELIGKLPEEILDAGAAFGAAVVNAVRQRQPVRDYPVSMDRGPDLPPQRLLLTVAPLENTETHEPMGVMITLKDDETRRQIESQLDVTTRLAAINRVTGGVAHEIKNPLNAIALHLELLKSKLRDRMDGEPGDLENEVKVISREITRLDRVVKTFLDFTRPVELKLRPVDLVEVSREVSTLMAPQAEARGISIVLESASDTAMVSGDRDLLLQALLNIVGNGVEAMENPGVVRIEVGCAPYTQCWVKVTDQGCGIPAEKRDRIFDLYFTTKQNGSGIGLAMAFRVVQLHQGTIELDSEPGRGSAFRLSFPVAGRRMLAAESMANAAHGLAKT